MGYRHKNDIPLPPPPPPSATTTVLVTTSPPLPTYPPMNAISAFVTTYTTDTRSLSPHYTSS